MNPVVHHLTVPRTGRYVVVGDPAGAAEVWVVLHGYSQLAQAFLKWFEPAERPERLFVAPEALSRSYFEEGGVRRVGASWMTKEDREAEIADYVRYLDLVTEEILGWFPAAPPLEVHGFSQGAAAACRWVAFGRHRVRRLTIWGGNVPPDLDLERLRGALGAGTLELYVGDRDRYVSPEAVEAEAGRLAAAGLAHQVIRFAGGHRVDAVLLDPPA